MKTVMAVSKNAQGLAGILATLATLVTMGGTLSLADHYASMSPAGSEYVAANSRAKQAIVCVNPENLQRVDSSVRPQDANSHPWKTAS